MQAQDDKQAGCMNADAVQGATSNAAMQVGRTRAVCKRRCTETQPGCAECEACIEQELHAYACGGAGARPIKRAQSVKETHRSCAACEDCTACERVDTPEGRRIHTRQGVR